MVYLLDTDGFHNALTQMLTRQGWPQNMLSDNGTNSNSGCNEINQSVSGAT